jgi:hypothetical protein
VHFSYRGRRLADSQPFVVPADSSAIFCSVDTPGVYTVDFYLTDQLGRVLHKELVVKCIDSPKPTAALQYEAVGGMASNYLYFFNASGSAQPYGAIVSYNYVINGQLQSVNHSFLKWFFHDSGTQQVDFYVVDDLGVSSDTLHYSIQVP